MDINLDMSAGNFTFRAAALIIHNGCLLTVKHDQYDCYYTPGGGVKLNETAAEAIIRELFEETNHRFEIDRLVFVQERFFTANGTNHHEVVFFYLIKCADFSVNCGTCTDKPEEHMYWMPLKDLSQNNLVPAFLRSALQRLPKEVVHIVSYDSCRSSCNQRR